MKAPITRRAFLTQVSAAGLAAPFIFPRLSFAKPPSGKLQHAAIGVGGQGASDLENIASSDKVKVYALCDIDENTLRKASQKYPGARLYRDWREMLHKDGGTKPVNSSLYASGGSNGFWKILGQVDGTQGNVNYRISYSHMQSHGYREHQSYMADNLVKNSPGRHQPK